MRTHTSTRDAHATRKERREKEGEATQTDTVGTKVAEVVEEVHAAAAALLVLAGELLEEADLVARGVGVLRRAAHDLQRDKLPRLRVARLPHRREVAPAHLAVHRVAPVLERVADVHGVVAALPVPAASLVAVHAQCCRHLALGQRAALLHCTLRNLLCAQWLRAGALRPGRRRR